MQVRENGLQISRFQLVVMNKIDTFNILFNEEIQFNQYF